MYEGLKYWRKERGLTQRELADRSGVGLNTIKKYELRDNFLHGARVETVERLSVALQVSHINLMGSEFFDAIYDDLNNRLPDIPY